MGFSRSYLEKSAARKTAAGKPGRINMQTCSINDHEWWNVTDLQQIANDLPTEEVSVTDLEHHLDVDNWFQCYEVPTPKAVMEHAFRVQKADLNFPIILMPGGQIADGIHRLQKAYLLGLKTIKAKRLIEMPCANPI